MGYVFSIFCSIISYREVWFHCSLSYGRTVACYYLQNKYGSIGVAAEKRRRIGDAKLLPGTVTRTQSRKAFADVNGAQDLPPSGPQNNAESNCSVVEFTKEDVEALVNEKAKLKNKFDSKVCG